MKLLLLGPKGRNERIERFLAARGNDVLVHQDSIDLDFLHSNGVDFLISNGYAHILSEPVISQYQRRAINLHPTFLPHGKGIFPTFWAFFEGAPTGVSIHLIDAGIDTGDILFQQRVSPEHNDTLRSFYDRLLTETELLFFEHWDEIALGHFTSVRQPDLGVQYRSRTDSEALMELLPRRWDTPIADVMALGADFALSELFWESYET